MTEIPHPNERAGRAEKVARLVAAIDAYNDRVADPHLHIDADFVGAIIENDGVWRILAGIAGTRLPSLTTRTHVESQLRVRDELAAKIAAGFDPLAGL